MIILHVIFPNTGVNYHDDADSETTKVRRRFQWLQPSP